MSKLSYRLIPVGRYRWAPLVTTGAYTNLVQAWYPTRRKALAHIARAGEKVCGFARAD